MKAGREVKLAACDAPSPALTRAAEPAKIPCMAERYEFVRKVAQGGFGHVYVARDRTLKREVAIKRLLSLSEGADAGAAEANFQREALVLAAMQHPNIVQIFDFDRDEEGSFVVMEMLEGKTLKDALEKGALTWDDFSKLVCETLDAMVAAHKAGILHRDLKPENIFLKRTVVGSWTVKVLDFGLAKLSQQPSRQTMDGKGNVFGSIYYMAPEQFRREMLDARTDLYALGCVFYQALTQRFPFYGETVHATMEAHLKHQVKPIELRRKDINPAMAAWLMKLLAVNRDARPRDAITARHEFEEALQGKAPEPAEVAPAPAPPSTPAPVAAKPGAARTPMPQAPRPAAGGGGPRTAKNGSAPRAAAVPPASRERIAAEPASVAPDGAGRKKPKRLRVALLAGVIAAVVVGLLIFFISNGWESRKQDGGGADARAASRGKGAPAPATPSLPALAPLSLPAEDKLTWRYRAGAETWHAGVDGKQMPGVPTKGQRVHEWQSIAPSLKEAPLKPFDGKPDSTPTAQSGDINGPGTAHQYLSFGPASGVEHRLAGDASKLAPGNSSSGSTGVTLAAVFRAGAGQAQKAASLRPVVLSSNWSPDTLSLHFSPASGQYSAQVQHGTARATPQVRPVQFEKGGAGGAWVVVLVSWDAKEGRIRLAVRSPDGKTVSADASVAPGMPMMDFLHLGALTLPKDGKLDPQEMMEGDMVEVAVYREALDRVAQDKVLNALWDRYFKKR